MLLGRRWGYAVLPGGRLWLVYLATQQAGVCLCSWWQAEVWCYSWAAGWGLIILLNGRLSYVFVAGWLIGISFCC